MLFVQENFIFKQFEKVLLDIFIHVPIIRFHTKRQRKLEQLIVVIWEINILCKPSH